MNIFKRHEGISTQLHIPDDLLVPPYESTPQVSSPLHSLEAVFVLRQREINASDFDADEDWKHNPTMNLDSRHTIDDIDCSISEHRKLIDSETVTGFIEHMRTLHRHDVVNNTFETRSVQLCQVGGALDSEKKAIFELLDHLTTREGVKLMCALLNVPCVDMIGALHSVLNLLSRSPKT